MPSAPMAQAWDDFDEPLAVRDARSSAVSYNGIIKLGHSGRESPVERTLDFLRAVCPIGACVSTTSDLCVDCRAVAAVVGAQHNIRTLLCGNGHNVGLHQLDSQGEFGIVVVVDKAQPRIVFRSEEHTS